VLLFHGIIVPNSSIPDSMPSTSSLKDKTRKLIESQHMLRGVALASFLESTVIPIPLEAILVPLMQARRDRLWRIALMATLGCALGALLGYAIGYALFDLVGDWLVGALSSPEQFEEVRQQMSQEGFWFVMTLGIAPIPFQLAMLAAGATGYSLLLFLLATFIARSIRYFGLAVAVFWAGDRAEELLRRYRFGAVAALIALLLVLRWVVELVAG